MADNFIIPGARQNGSNKGVVFAATDIGTDAQGRTILALSTAAPVGGATEAKQDTQITAEQAILAKQPSLGTALVPSGNVLSVQHPAVTQVISTALEAEHVLKAGAGQLVQLSVFNSGAAQFILLMNSVTVPADGAVLLLFPPIPIAAASLTVLDLPAPLVASTGIAVCNSSTGTFTKTVGAADCVFYAQIN